jgi:hypothetical protein
MSINMVDILTWQGAFWSLRMFANRITQEQWVARPVPAVACRPAFVACPMSIATAAAWARPLYEAAWESARRAHASGPAVARNRLNLECWN